MPWGTCSGGGLTTCESLPCLFGGVVQLKRALRHYQQIRDHAAARVAQLNARLARLDQPLEELAQL